MQSTDIQLENKDSGANNGADCAAIDKLRVIEVEPSAPPVLQGNAAEMVKTEIGQRILHALERARPYLQIDGGDVELVNIDLSAGIVEVRLLGACKTCSMSIMTLRAGIERMIIHDVPEIKRVESVSILGK